MSRAVGGLVRQLLKSCEGAVAQKQKQQQRSFFSNRYSPKQFSRDTPSDKSSAAVPKDPFYEAWVWRRDHFENEFAWNARSTFEAFYFLGGFTVAMYSMGIMMARSADKRSGYPRREMLGAESGTDFNVPDEREFY